MKLHLKWSLNNEKLKKLGTASFNLPAFRSADGFKVCPQAGACASMCYARQGRYVISSVAATREFNLRIARKDLRTFRRLAIEDLRQLKNPSIRLHDSGDFFSQAYLNAWCDIMRAFPDKVFYAYTKSIHLDFSRAPKNFQVVQSMGGKLDAHIDPERSHSRIFASHADREAAGYVNGNENDGPAIRGEQRIGLVYHGTRSLKPGQILYLKG